MYIDFNFFHLIFLNCIMILDYSFKIQKIKIILNFTFIISIKINNRKKEKYNLSELIEKMIFILLYYSPY